MSRPLTQVDATTISNIAQALWASPACADCHGEAEGCCTSSTCSAGRGRRLKRYMQYYRGLLDDYLESSRPTARLLRTHDDIHNAMSVLEANPDASRVEYHRLAFPENADPTELMNASTLVVKIMFMTDCSHMSQSPGKIRLNRPSDYWRDDVSFSKYLQDHFPTEQHHIFSSVDGDTLSNVEGDLKATRLVKYLDISFQATYDICNHLRFNRKMNTLQIFHHTSFLKEQLRSTREMGGDTSSMSSCIRLGVVPRQLALEVLESLQTILFPLSDPKSEQYLAALVTSLALDPDVMRFESAAIRRPGEEEGFSYVYFAERLAELHAELQSPRPRGWLERQVERKSGARYMMLATLVGVVFAVVLGMASLALSSYQTWIAYQAWQHPVSPSG